MLVTHEDGNVKVVRKRDARNYSCLSCGAQEVSLWIKSSDEIYCKFLNRSIY